MNGTFELASGSIVGSEHVGRHNILAGTNNHDAFATFQNAEDTLAIVVDGCGSGKHSEVGAKLAARITLSLLTKHICALKHAWKRDKDTGRQIWNRLRDDVTAQLSVLANSLGGSFSQTITDYFLFTIVIAIVTKEHTVVASMGDGVYSLNGLTTIIGPFPGNKPPYMMYRATGSQLLDEHPELFEFTQNLWLPTEEVNSLVIGTDGLNDLIKSADRKIPGKDELVGPFDQFWNNPKFFSNPDLLRRRLSLINRNYAALRTADGKPLPELVVEPGLLPDDTTLVVIRRKPEVI